MSPWPMDAMATIATDVAPTGIGQTVALVVCGIQAALTVALAIAGTLSSAAVSAIQEAARLLNIAPTVASAGTLGCAAAYVFVASVAKGP